jgi:hypothetical protein
MDANARRIPGRLEDRFEAPDATAKIDGQEFPCVIGAREAYL